MTQYGPPVAAGGRTGGLKGGEWICGISGKNDTIIYKWMKFVTDYAQELEFARDNGRIVLNNKVMANPEVTKNIIAKASLEGFKGGLDSGLYFIDKKRWCEPMNTVSDLVWSGKITPKEGGEMMVQKINELYSDEE